MTEGPGAGEGVLLRWQSRRWVGLGFLLGAVLLVAMDQTVVVTVLPRLARDLDVGVDAAAWSVTAFILVAAVTLAPMGQFADWIGRRRLLIVSLLAFAVGSAITASAENLPWLLGGRALQGLVFAALAPAILGLLNLSFPAGPERTVAFALWSMTTASAVAIGPLVGGAFAALASWRDAFLLNLPLCVLVAGGVLLFVADDRRGFAGEATEGATGGAAGGAIGASGGAGGSARGFDLPGALLLGLIMLTSVLGLQQGDAWGWWRAEGAVGLFGLSPVPLLLAASLVSVLGLVLVERRRGRAARAVLLAPSILEVRSYRLALAAAGVMSMALYGLLVVLPIYLQVVLAADPLESGAALCMLGAGMLTGGLASQALIARFGRKRTALLGLGVQVFILAAMLPAIGVDATPGAAGVLLLPYGAAYSIAFSALMNRLLSEIPPALSSRAGALSTMVRLGLAAVATALMVGLVIGISVAETKTAILDDRALSAEQRGSLKRLTHFRTGAGAARDDDRSVLSEMALEPATAPLIAKVQAGFAMAGRGAILMAACLALASLLIALRLPAEPARDQAVGRAARPVVALRLPADLDRAQARDRVPQPGTRAINTRDGIADGPKNAPKNAQFAEATYPGSTYPGLRYQGPRHRGPTPRGTDNESS